MAVEVTARLSNWSPDLAGGAPNIALSARCEVEATGSGGGTLDVKLACLDEADGSFEATLLVTAPPDLAVAVPSGEVVQLEYAGHRAQGEIGPGWRLALRSASGDLIVAAHDDETPGYIADSWSQMIAPLAAALDTGMCPTWPCPTDARPDCPEGGTFERHGLLVRSGQRSVGVLDGRRDVLTTDERSYDVLVSSAAGWYATSGRHSYRFLITPRR